MKRVYIKVFGCQMNVRDSEVICGLLRRDGYQITDKAQEADIILFNTCSVRQHAEDKVWSEVGRFKKSKIKNQKSKIIGIVGCMAQNYTQDIFKRAPNVDFIVGTSDIHKIAEVIKKFSATSPPSLDNRLFEMKIWETDGSLRPEEIYHTGFYHDKQHAYVVISEGCSNFCSYCVVPYVRGQLRNRNYKDILREIEEAVDRGITRVTLLGQNVNAYVSNSNIKNQISKIHTKRQRSDKEIDFIDLLEMVNKIKGIEEFSFITSHPKDATVDLFKAMQDLDKLRKYLHLPLQSGSHRILELMNRNYSGRFYLDLVGKYRKIVKNGTLTTDIIVGFPGETDKDFQATLSLVEEIKFDAAYIFKYSPRLHTQAASFIDDVPLEEKQKRHHVILELQKRISKKIQNQKFKCTK